MFSLFDSTPNHAARFFMFCKFCKKNIEIYIYIYLHVLLSQLEINH